MGRRGRWQSLSGEWNVEGLKDLRKGDKVYCTFWGNKYIPTVVTRVRTVECATIVTVENRDGLSSKRFVGYHTGRYATGDNHGVLTLNNYNAEWAEKSLEKASDNSMVIAKRADALNALRVLKVWLNQPEDEGFYNSEVE